MGKNWMAPLQNATPKMKLLPSPPTAPYSLCVKPKFDLADKQLEAQSKSFSAAFTPQSGLETAGIEVGSSRTFRERTKKGSHKHHHHHHCNHRHLHTEEHQSHSCLGVGSN